MYPELFRIGDFPINAYGVWFALGLFFGLIVAGRLAEKNGLSKARIYDLGLWSIIGGLIGSKLLLFVTEDNISFFSMDLLRSGGVYFGGFLGGFLALAVLIRHYKLPFWKVGDVFAPGVALGQFFGRQGCFSSGDSWGKETLLPWGVQFTEKAHLNTGVPIYGPDGSDLYLHPTQLYESFAMIIVFGFLIYLFYRRRFDGQILIAYAIIYSIVRFVIEFFRGDQRGDLFGLTTTTGLSTSQLISLIVAAVSIIFLYRRLKRTDPGEVIDQDT